MKSFWLGVLTCWIVIKAYNDLYADRVEAWLKR